MAKISKNPSSTSSAAPKSIFLRLYDREHGLVDIWRKINISMEEDDTVYVSKMPEKTPPVTNSVALGSVIYALGTNYSNQVSREVYYLDTRRPELGWKKAPSLSRPRGDLYLAVHRGKIYAVEHGGYKSNDGSKYESPVQEEDWCEVFDPISRVWQPMLGPDCETLAKARKWSDPDRSRPNGEGVLLDSRDGLFWYDLLCNSWTVMNKISSTTKWDGTILDNVVYFFHRKVRAYDLGNGRFYKKKVKGLKGRRISPYLRYCNAFGSPSPNFPIAFVVVVGEGKLCLLYQSRLGLHCTRFRVSVHSDGDEDNEILATIEMFRIYDVNEDYYLRSCVAI